MQQVRSRIFHMIIFLTAVVLNSASADARGLRCSSLFETSAIEAIRPLTIEQMHYLVLGADKPGDPVLMIHGVGSSLGTFHAAALELAKTKKVVIFDLRGHGKTQDPGAGYDLPTLVSDIHSLAQALKLKHIQLIGHSAGAKLAMLFATQFPGLVSSVVIEDSGVLPMGTPDQTETIRKEVQFLRSLTRQYVSADELATDLLPIADQNPDKALDLAQKVFPVGTRQSAVTIEFWKNFKSSNTTAFVKGFTKPVLFLRAAPATRYFTDKDVDLIKEQMPSAKIVTIEKSSHSIHETTPNEWLSAVKVFLH